MQETADVIIIGAGIIGAACAFHLGERGAKVAVLEMQQSPVLGSKRVLFGRSNPHEPPGFTEGMDWEWFEQTLTAGVERFPWLAETQLDVQASWWGYYEVTPDHYPILGRMPGMDTWVNAAGFSGHGVQQAPAIGRVIAEEILDGRAHSIIIDPLRIERFANAPKAREHNIF